MFILNTNHNVYHTEDCQCIPTIHKNNIRLLDKAPVTAAPCSHCKPHRTGAINYPVIVIDTTKYEVGV